MEKAIEELAKCFNRALNANDQLLRDRDSQISNMRTEIYGLERKIAELESENRSLKATLKNKKGESDNG